jgi:nicotinamide-nucleotide amidase
MTFDPVLLKLAEAVLSEARARTLRIVTAESCTGGLVAAALTEIPGSSDVLLQGWVAYSDAAKQEALGVPEDTLRMFGAVSEPTARAMAHRGARRRHEREAGGARSLRVGAARTRHRARGAAVRRASIAPRHPHGERRSRAQSVATDGAVIFSPP